jgi:hypothetical protein
MTDCAASQFRIGDSMRSEAGLERQLGSKQCALHRSSKIVCACRRCCGRFELGMRTPDEVFGARSKLPTMAELLPPIAEVENISSLIGKTRKLVRRFRYPPFLYVIEIDKLPEVDRTFSKAPRCMPPVCSSLGTKS